MLTWRLLPACALALALGLAPAAQAAPASPAFASGVTQGSDANVIKVRDRWGRGAGVGIGLGILGAAIIANEAYRPRRGYYYDDYAYDGPYYYPSSYAGDPRAVCAENFRSFEWRTGMYTTYSGERRVCPYLR